MGKIEHPRSEHYTDKFGSDYFKEK